MIIKTNYRIGLMNLKLGEAEMNLKCKFISSSCARFASSRQTFEIIL